MTDPQVVCDASAVVAVLLDSGPDGGWVARRVAHHQLCAPALLPFEAANIIRRHELAGFVSADQAAQAHRDLLDLPLQLFPYEALALRIWDMRRNVTAYDGSYVALAEVLGAPLVTLDRRLLTAPGVRCAVEAPT